MPFAFYVRVVGGICFYFNMLLMFNALFFEKAVFELQRKNQNFLIFLVFPLKMGH